MKAQFQALFWALPPLGKFLWLVMGALPLLGGTLALGYSLYWALTPASAHPALAPDPTGALSNLLYGTVATGVAGFVGRSQLRAQRAREHLIQFGQRLDLPITKVEESLLRGRNGGRYYYLYCHWHDPATGKRHAFESERLPFDPSAHLRHGDTLPLYFEPGHPEHYYLDVRSLPRPKGFFD